MLHDTKNASKEPIDNRVYDVMKYFDSLWDQECNNIMFEAGVYNDKLNYLWMFNKNAQVAVQNLSLSLGAGKDWLTWSLHELQNNWCQSAQIWQYRYTGDILVKKQIYKFAFQYLETRKNWHKKVKRIVNRPGVAGAVL